MSRFLSTLLACTLLAGGAMAAGKPVPSSKPAAAPAAQEADASPEVTAAPVAPMAAPYVPPGMSAEQMIKALGAIKHSRAGGETAVAAPKRVQRMLMGKQQGKIGGGDKDKDKKKGQLTQITKTGDYPYATIGLVASGCSGTLVMQRFVLTAAWCVYDVKGKKFYENLDFYPGQNGKKSPFGSVKWKNAWVAQGFVDTGDLNFGYGLIELEEPVGDKLGWFGFGPLAKGKEKQLTLTGYPFEGVPAQTMWETKCNIDAAEENAYFYRCPGDPKSLTAMLGSPLWMKGEADDSWQILGIHVTAQDDKMNGWWAARLTAAHTETLLGWANDAGKQTEDQGEEEEEDMSEEDTDEGGTDQVTDGGGAECTCEDQASPQ